MRQWVSQEIRSSCNCYFPLNESTGLESGMKQGVKACLDPYTVVTVPSLALR